MILKYLPYKNSEIDLEKYSDTSTDTYSLTVEPLGLIFEDIPVSWQWIGTDDNPVTTRLVQVTPGTLAIQIAHQTATEFNIRLGNAEATSGFNNLYIKFTTNQNRTFQQFEKVQKKRWGEFKTSLEQKNEFRATHKEDMKWDNCQMCRIVIECEDKTQEDPIYTCEGLFGHSNNYEFTIDSTKLDSQASLFDFVSLAKAAPKQLLAKLAKSNIEPAMPVVCEPMEPEHKSSWEILHQVFETIDSNVSQVIISYDKKIAGNITLEWTGGSATAFLEDIVAFVDAKREGMTTSYQNKGFQEGTKPLLQIIDSKGAFSRFPPGFTVFLKLSNGRKTMGIQVGTLDLTRKKASQPKVQDLSESETTFWKAVDKEIYASAKKSLQVLASDGTQEPSLTFWVHPEHSPTRIYTEEAADGDGIIGFTVPSLRKKRYKDLLTPKKLHQHFGKVLRKLNKDGHFSPIAFEGKLSIYFQSADDSERTLICVTTTSPSKNIKVVNATATKIDLGSLDLSTLTYWVMDTDLSVQRAEFIRKKKSQEDPISGKRPANVALSRIIRKYTIVVPSLHIFAIAKRSVHLRKVRIYSRSFVTLLEAIGVTGLTTQNATFVHKNGRPDMSDYYCFIEGIPAVQSLLDSNFEEEVLDADYYNRPYLTLDPTTIPKGTLIFVPEKEPGDWNEHKDWIVIHDAIKTLMENNSMTKGVTFTQVTLA